jgi:hypothetical protein
MEPELRKIADKVFRGERFASAEERLLIDEAFARIDSLSPWMEERARRAFGMAADGAATGDTDERGDLHTAGGLSAAARERQYRMRQRQL